MIKMCQFYVQRHLTSDIWHSQAFDQFIETPEGAVPPELTDVTLAELGHKRVGQLREYKRMMDALDLRRWDGDDMTTLHF